MSEYNVRHVSCAACGEIYHDDQLDDHGLCTFCREPEEPSPAEPQYPAPTPPED